MDFSPEHPIFPKDADYLRDPNRAPTDHEREIISALMRFKQPPDFNSLPAPTPEQREDAIARLDALLDDAPDPVRDQDDRLLTLAHIVADHMNIFGRNGFHMAVELIGGSKLIEQSEYRRAFIREYVPQEQKVKNYLRRLASLRRRAHSARDKEPALLRDKAIASERSAAAQEQMEVVESMPEHQVLEKYWRMLEIVSNYRDVFTPEQFEMVAGNNKADVTWRAHLAKARDEHNQLRTILKTGAIMRQLTDSVIQVLRGMATGKISERPAGSEPTPGTDAPDAPDA